MKGPPSLAPAVSGSTTAASGLAFRTGRPVARQGEAAPAAEPAAATGHAMRIGVVSNARSHRNRMARAAGRADAETPAADVLVCRPHRTAELAEGIARFAREGVDLIVIDGGDGTIRDVITCVGNAYADRRPRFAIVPSGKTNALALDLGVPATWTLADAIAAARSGQFATRAPLEIIREGSNGVDLRGFLFGTGGFVRATALAQRAHKAGAFNSFAVGVSLGWATLQTLIGGARNPWRTGDAMRISGPGLPTIDGQQYVLLASTIERLPLGVKPFGTPRPGLKLFSVDAPPRRLSLLLPAIIGGTRSETLARHGYRRLDAQQLQVSFAGSFILDGEVYPGGTMTIRQGAPIAFAVP